MQRTHTSKPRPVALMAALWLMVVASAPVRAEPMPLPADLLDRAAALAVDASTNRFPDADTVLLAGLQRHRYAPDGTFSQWHEEYIKILTEKGRREHLTLTSHFVIPYQRGPEDCQIAAVNVIKPDGTVVAIDVEGQSRVMINPESMESNIYNPNEKLIGLNVGGLEVGDVLHFVMFDRIVQPRMAGSWSDWYVLESTRPIMRQIVEVEAPAALPLARVALKDPAGDSVRYTQVARDDGGVLHRWEARDVPQVFPEPNMPPLPTVVQRVLVSTVPDWEYVSRWYWTLSQPHYVMTPAIEAKVVELTTGVEDADARLRALFGFVAQEIRYMGIIAESEAPGYEPHDVGDTFAARHGVCRDKAALLVCMLRAAGFEAYPTLIYNGPKKDPEVPQPYFNHAIVAVRVGDGWRLMDPTDETTRELLPSYLDDCSYLVATPEGDGLRTSPIAPATDNLMRIETLGSLDADGRLRAETVLQFDGINDNAYRQYFAQLQPQERQRLLEGAVRAAVPGARIEAVDLLPLDLMDVSTGLSARVAYTAEDVLLRGGGLAMLPLPLLGTRVGLINFILGQTGLQERRFPLKTLAACGVRERVLIELDSMLDTPEALPVGAPLDTGGAYWDLQVRQGGRVLDAQAECRLDAVEFSPSEYRALKSLRVEVERALRKMPIYAVAGGEGGAGDTDAVVEDERVLHDWTVDGVARETRTVRKRILTYAGKKQHSELVIRFNPIWDDVELVRGAVETADGRTVEISPAEINIMDADWVGSAPRYPPGHLMVASFPAVDVGAVIDYQVVITRRDRPFLTCREIFGGSEATRVKQVEIRARGGHDLHVHRHGLEGTSIEEAIFAGGPGMDSYAWSAVGLPATRREDDMPPDWLLHPTVSLSSGTWKGYADVLHKALEQAASRQSMCLAEGRRLGRTSDDPWQQVRAIRDRVMQGVRLAGPTLPELPLSAITPADRTLQDGYGTVTDRAVVLAAMLRAAGFDVAFVAVSRRPALAAFRESLDAVAEPDVFTDVLVQVGARGLDLPVDRGLYLGEGDQYGSLGASAFEGMWALSLPQGECMPLRPVHEDRLWTEHMLQVDAGGDVALTQRTLFFGTAFGAEHRRYREMPPEEARRYHEELIARFSQGAQARGVPVVDFSSYPGRVEFSVTLPGYAVRDGEFLYLRLPESIESVLRLRSDRRAQPLFLDGRGVWKSRCVVDVPEGFVPVMVPKDRLLEGLAGMRIDLRTVREPLEGSARISLHREVSREPALVPPADYTRLAEWERYLGQPQTRTLVLRRTDVEPAFSK